MKTNSYKGLISRTDDSRKEQELEFVVEEASQQMQADILATKKQIATCRKELDQSKSAIPFSPKKCLEKQVELEGYELGLKKLTELNNELFAETNNEQSTLTAG